MPFVLEKLRAGDRAEWQRLCRHFWGLTVSVARGAHPSMSGQDAEEAAQDAFTALVDNVARLHSAEEIKPLLLTIVRRKAVSLMRVKYAQCRGAGLGESLEALLESGAVQVRDAAPEPDRALQSAQVAALLLAALGELKPVYANLLRGRYWRGLDYTALAAENQLGEGSVGVYLRRGLGELREILEKKGVGLQETADVLRL